MGSGPPRSLESVFLTLNTPGGGSILAVSPLRGPTAGTSTRGPASVPSASYALRPLPLPRQATVLLRSDPSVICPEKNILFGSPYYLPLSLPAELMFSSVR